MRQHIVLYTNHDLIIQVHNCDLGMRLGLWLAILCTCTVVQVIWTHSTIMKHLLSQYACRFSVTDTYVAMPTNSYLYKLVALQCTGLTCCGSIYPHIDALKCSSGIAYVTAEDSCCGSPRITVEKYCSRSWRP